VFGLVFPVRAVHHRQLRGLTGAGELEARSVTGGHRRRRRRRRAQLLRVVGMRRVVVVVTHAVVRVHHAGERHALHAGVRVVRGRGRQPLDVHGTHVAARHLTGRVGHRGGRLAERPRVVHEAGLQVLGRGQVAVAVSSEQRLPRLEVRRRRSERPLHPAAPPVVPLLEHVLAGRVEGPVVPLALPAALPRDFDEALVEAQVVPDAVLPALLVLLVEGELGDDVLVDAGQGEALLGALADGHGDKRDVGVRRLLGRVGFLRDFLLRRRLLLGSLLLLGGVGVVDHEGGHRVILRVLVSGHHCAQPPKIRNTKNKSSPHKKSETLINGAVLQNLQGVPWV